ncbi:MAG: 3-deoxy-D-manno-octulosonic acid transferase, partial [Chitinophagaceae bacterium]
NEKHLLEIEKLYPDAVRFSALLSIHSSQSNCLIIDNIGMLSRLYKYSYISYIGGGLKSSGIHNVLEAAVYNKVVVFGPYYKKYSEAVDLVKTGGGISFDDDKNDGAELKIVIEMLLKNQKEFIVRSTSAGDFVTSHKGATQKILQFIQENRLLTN